MDKFPRLRLLDGTEYLFAGSDAVSRRIVVRFAEAMELEYRNASAGQSRVSVVLGHPWAANSRDAGNRLEASVIDPGGNGTLLAVQFMRIASIIARDAERRGGVLLHGALTKRDGYGVLMAGPGGMGKTTAARRLVPPWRALCDDTALVVRGPGNVYWAHPWPTWSRFISGGAGGRWDVQQAVPLRGIFFLARDERDRAEPMGTGRAATLLVEAAEQVSIAMFGGLDKETIWALRLQRFDNICRLARAVPGFELRLSLTGVFWKEMERVLEGAAIPSSPLFS